MDCLFMCVIFRSYSVGSNRKYSASERDGITLSGRESNFLIQYSVSNYECTQNICFEASEIGSTLHRINQHSARASEVISAFRNTSSHWLQSSSFTVA